MNEFKFQIYAKPLLSTYVVMSIFQNIVQLTEALFTDFIASIKYNLFLTFDFCFT